MELRKHCAYNQTRECFLGLDVAAADLPYANLKGLMTTLTLRSGEGLWMTPFRGIPATGLRSPMDLVYLDEEHRVTETVESFPTFGARSSAAEAASVLALPAHSIYSSQTQPGDQMVLCVAEEMESQLERLSNVMGEAGTEQRAVLLREKPLWSGGPGVLELEDRSKEQGHREPEMHEMRLAEPETEKVKTPRRWQGRWWAPDPRKAPRQSAPAVAAYYWDGSTPEAHGVRDISSSGLYVETEERWYPGTLVLMTLHRTDAGETSTERSISVQSRAVRWGKDGVGLQFVVRNAQNAGARRKPSMPGADRKELDRFLERLRKAGR